MTLPTTLAPTAKTNSTGAAVTPAIPAAAVAGDVLFLVASTIAGGSISITNDGGAAWNALGTGFQDVTNGEKLYVWYKVMQAGDGDPTVDPATDHICATIFGYHNVDPDTPVEAIAWGSETTSDTSFSFAPGNSTNGADRICCVIYSSGMDSNTGQGGTITNAALASVTMLAEYQTTSGGGGGFVIGEGDKAVAGSVGTWGDNAMVTATTKAYVAFAVRPTPPVVAIAGGAITGSSGFSGTVVPLRGILAGAITASSSISGGITAESGAGPRPIVGGAFTGASTVSGGLVALRRVTGVITATSSLSGNVRALRRIAGAITGVSSVTGGLRALRRITGQITAISALSGGIRRLARISGQISATSSVSGTVQKQGQVFKSIAAGQIVALSSFTGSIRRKAAVTGQITIVSSVSGSIIKGTLKPLTGQISANSVLSGVLEKRSMRPVVGTLSSTSTVSGTVQIQVVNPPHGPVPLLIGAPWENPILERARYGS